MKRKIVAKQQYVTYAGVPLVSGDVRAYEIVLELGEDIPGAVLKVTAIRADGKVIEDVGENRGNVLAYTMANNMYAVPGELIVRLSVVEGSSALTCKEIIFEVKEGATEGEIAETSVVINDGVLIRISSIEAELANKVDKADGMGLSANDFTDEYKAKLDGLDKTIDSKVDALQEDVDEEIRQMSEELGDLADELNVFERETNNKLGLKVDMADGSNLLFSAVESIEDLTYIESTDFNGDALYTTDWNGVECREDPIGEYDSDKKELYFPVEMVFEKPEDYLKIPIKSLTLTKGVYSKNLYCLNLPKDGAHVDDITPVVDFECYLGDYVFIYSDTNPAERNEYVEITEDVTVDYIIIKSRTFPNCVTCGTIRTDTMFLSNLMVCRGYLIAPGAYYGQQYKGYEDGNKNNAIFYDKSTGQAHLNKMPFKDLAGLHNVDNTSDLEKPISAATQEALDLKVDKSTTYTKAEVDTKLNNKVDKSDIANVYKYMGSVDAFDDLPFRYQLIPNGIPTHNGEPCGTYGEETHTVTIEETMLEGSDDRIIVPIVPIDIKAGEYFTDGTHYGDAYIGNLCTYVCGAGGDSYVEMPEQTIDHIEIFMPNDIETISGTTNNLGTLDKILVSWCTDERVPNYPYIPQGAYDNGAVYNVLADGMDYAWKGSSWDALGGEHKDIEAREDIAKLQEQVGEFELAIDTVIALCDNYIDGGA